MRPPGSKSETQRYFNLALLADSPSSISGALQGDDTDLYLRGLEGLGVAVQRTQERLELSPGQPPPRATLECGHGGTMLRFLTAALTTLPGRWRLEGSRRLAERPMLPLVDVLCGMGATVQGTGSQQRAPVEVEGPSLRGGVCELDASQSSQFLSAVLMAGLRAAEPIEVTVYSLTSAPYVDLTVEAIEAFGGAVESSATGYRVSPTTLHGASVRVEADWSSAAYPLAAAVVTRGAVTVEGVRAGSLHPDRRWVELLEEAGAVVTWSQDGVRVEADGPLRFRDVDLSTMPDQVPTLAALAPFARGTTTIRNVGHLRWKESDRLAAMTSELTKLGVPVRATNDSLAVEGVWADREPADTPVTVATHGDHRVAMSLAIAALRRPGVSIETPDVVGKSYPGFWRDLEQLIGTECPRCP